MFVNNECLNRFSYKAAIGDRVFDTRRSRILPLETNPGFVIMTRKTKGNMECSHPGSLSVKKFKTVPSAKKVMLTIFWVERGCALHGISD